VIVTRNRDGQLRAFYNVCRHRGAQLCDGPSGQVDAMFQCPYHAWCYDLDGALVATPKVGEDEVDRASLGLSVVHVDEWQGFVFVNLSLEQPRPLRNALDGHYDSPLRFEKHQLDRLHLLQVTEAVVEANWKIIVENYNECLHCPIVHPELVSVVPLYRKGMVNDPTRHDGGTLLTAGGTTYSGDLRARRTVLPGLAQDQVHAIFGAQVFPNMFLDIAGSNVVSTRLAPEGPTRTRVYSEYLFIPEDMAEPDFDPRPVVDFCELVAHQDFAVSERVQRGVTSRGFAFGVYPEKDSYVHAFNEYYRAVMARD
jgi:Rieske 2Fe-2S family protein